MRTSLILLFLSAALRLHAHPVNHTGPGSVATVHPLATAAGMAVLEQGGNAIDAAVAAAATLGVVDGFNSGFGGGCFILIRRADGTFLAIDGRETAPAAATRDMFIREGKAVPALSETGPLAVGVPGALAAYHLALQEAGSMRWAELLTPAAQLAEKGFDLSPTYAERLAGVAEAMRQSPEARKIFFNGKRPLRAGERLKQPDLARTYRALARHGPEWFYRGDYAEKVAKWMTRNGGLLTADDFAQYRAVRREPLRTRYRGQEIVGFPPPSSGGVHVAQILNIASAFDLKSLGRSTPEGIHVVAEAMKLAFADRAYWLGDPAFTPVPRGLIDEDYAKTLSGKIRLDQAIQVTAHGAPPDAAANVFKKHTTHFCATDRAGNWVSCTATINTTFGSKVIVPGTGLVLNNEMDDFSAQPGAANYFGLVGAEANAVAPGKRPLSSMAPTLVLTNGTPYLALGAAGGPTIISQVVLAIIGVVDFQLDSHEALAAPRFHQQWRPDELRVEKAIAPSVRRSLETRGHRVVAVEQIGASQAIGRTSNGWQSVREPRMKD